MDRFTRELSHELTKRLPQNMEYGWSRRIEGALERNSDTGAHDDVAIIVDSEISPEEYKGLWEKLYLFVKGDKYYRQSHYRILVWKQGKLSLVSSKRFLNTERLKNYLEEIEVGYSDPSDWDGFWQQYKPHKRAGQVIMMIPSEKVASMEDSKPIGIKNLLIIYQGTPETKVKKMVRTIPCIAYTKDTKKGGKENE